MTMKIREDRGWHGIADDERAEIAARTEAIRAAKRRKLSGGGEGGLTDDELDAVLGPPAGSRHPHSRGGRRP